MNLSLSAFQTALESTLHSDAPAAQAPSGFGAMLQHAEKEFMQDAFKPLHNPAEHQLRVEQVTAALAPESPQALPIHAKTGALDPDAFTTTSQPGYAIGEAGAAKVLLQTAVRARTPALGATAWQLNQFSHISDKTAAVDGVAPNIPEVPERNAPVRRFRFYRAAGNRQGLVLNLQAGTAGLWNDPVAMQVLHNALQSGLRPDELVLAGHKIILPKE